MRMAHANQNINFDREKENGEKPRSWRIQRQHREERQCCQWYRVSRPELVFADERVQHGGDREH